MDPRAICALFGFGLLILIIIWLMSGGDDDAAKDAQPLPVVPPKVNICKQTEQAFNKLYLVENNLNHLRLNDNYTDIALVLPNQIIRAHKIVLASHSQYFDGLIWANTNSSASTDDVGDHASHTQRIRIESVDEKTLNAVLNFMYSGTLSDDLLRNVDNRGRLLRAANQFQMESLKCELSQRLESRIDIRNVGAMVALATDTDARFLMIVASNFLLNEFKTVSQTNEWNAVIRQHKDILANAIDFHANLPENTTCNIQCVSSSLQSPAVFTQLRQFFLARRFADAEIHVKPNDGGETKVFHVNRATLVGQSAAFQRAFGDSQQIEVSGTDIEVMEEFLIYMYSGWPTQRIKKMPTGLLYLSAIYEMSGLQTACEGILIDDLKIQNAAEIIVVADKANSKRLFSIALDFILKNRRDVVKTTAWIDLKRNHPEILTKIIAK